MSRPHAPSHEKGVLHGQLRGDARALIVQEFADAKMPPSEWAKRQIGGLAADQFHSYNRAHVPTKRGAGEISREAKSFQLKEAGMTKDKLDNLLNISRIIKKEDREERDKRDDKSDDVMGIVRRLDVTDEFRGHFWTKKGVKICHYLGKQGRLVFNVDATGGLLDFPAVEDMKGKVLHTILAVSPKYALLKDGSHHRDKTVSRMLSPLKLGEMVSNKNTGKDYFEMYQAFRATEREMFPDEEVTRPLLILTDCSAQLQSGSLLAYSSGEGMADTRIEYGNRTLLCLLCYDAVVSRLEDDSGSSSEELKDEAGHILAYLSCSVGVFLKECKSHVYRSPSEWLARICKRTNEFVLIRARVEDILKETLSLLLDENRISNAIVQLTLVAAMFDTEYFDAQEFDAFMEPKEHKGPIEKQCEQRLLRTIDAFIKEEAEQLRIGTLEQVGERLKDVNEIKSKHILLHSPIMERAKELMKMMCCVYLHSVSTSNNDSRQVTGTLRCSVVYGRSFDVESGEMVPWKNGGNNVSVALPFTSGQVKNPLYSPSTAHYLLTTWAKKISFWSRGIIDLIETAKEMEIESSNQMAEATIRRTKLLEKAREHSSEPAQYIRYLWDSTERATKEFVSVLQTLNGRIVDLMDYREKKKKKRRQCNESEAAAPAPAGLTQDVLTQQAEDDQLEVWSRKGSHVELELNLRKELLSIFDEDESAIGGNANTRRYEYVKKSFNAIDQDAFMSYPTFNNYLNGARKAKRPMDKKQVELLQKFIHKKRPGKPTAAVETEAEAQEPIESVQVEV